MPKGEGLLQKNQVVRTQCQRLGAELEGVCFPEGMAMFVPFVLPGEEISCRVVKVEKRHAFGKLLEVHSMSPDRQKPPCPVYGRCGGCAAQHMTYEATLKAKRDRVSGCFAHIAGLQVDVPQVLGMAEPWHYRNKLALPVAGEPGRPRIGYYAPRSHDIVEIAECPVVMGELSKVLSAVKGWMEEFSIHPYQEESHTGLVRHIMARASQAGEVMVVLSVNGASIPHEKELLAALKRRVPSLVSLCLTPNTRRGNVILGDSFEVLWGRERLIDTLCGLRFALSPLSFFQINPRQTEVLYKTALDFAGLTGGETVADLYCGAGTISLLLARHASRVIGIESVEAAVLDARENARENGVANAEFLNGEAEALLPGLVSQGLRFDVMVLDPPRKGAQAEVLKAIAQASPRRVVYVSCDPATQARDAAILKDLGYRIVRCQPVDMFCWTHGVENVLAFDRREG